MSTDTNTQAASEQPSIDGVEQPTAESTTPEAILEKAQAELAEQKNKYLYLYAEFETFKKRAIKERSELVKFGHEPLVRELLGVSDNLGRALAHTNNLEALVTGIRMVNQQLQDTLARFAVKPLESVGQGFNPEFHEAVAQEKSEQNEGTVIQEHLKGYTLHGRLLRPAKVVVSIK